MTKISALVGANSDQGPYRSENQDAYWVSNTQTPVITIAEIPPSTTPTLTVNPGLPSPV